MSKWLRFDSTGALDEALADHIADQLRRDIDGEGRASLAVSGGGTPRPMFQRLSHCDLDWSCVWVTLVDERWVAPDSPASNERLVREHLLQNRAAGAHFASMKTAHPDARDGLAEAQRRLEDIPMPFSVTVLGMGGDGHTASWFPRAENLRELLDPEGTASLGATYPVTAEHQRITLTFPAVLRSREIVIHITGEEKQRVLHDAIQQDYPIAAVLKQNTTLATIWWAP